MNPEVDWFFNKASKWQLEYAELRLIALEAGLKEELKWGCPCYTYNKSNVVLIHGFKDYCALLFHKGALMRDKKGLLIQQTKNVQAQRQIRFTKIQEIVKNKLIIEDYIKDAINIEIKGLKVELKETSKFEIPEEFKIILDDIPAFKTAFQALTPGRQRAYLLYFSAPKQRKTRETRIEKYYQQILDGKGLND